MAVFRNKKDQKALRNAEVALRNAGELIISAESKGINPTTFRQALQNGWEAFNQKDWIAAINIGNDVINHVRREVKKVEHDLIEDERIRNETQQLFSKVEHTFQSFKKKGIDLRMGEYQNAKNAFEKGNFSDAVSSLHKIEELFKSKSEKIISQDKGVGWLQALVSSGEYVIAGYSETRESWVSKEDTLYCLDRKGKLIWSNKAGDISGITASENIIVVGIGSKILCFDKKGQQLWGHYSQLKSDVDNVALLGDSIVASDYHKIHYYDQNKNLLWENTTDHVSAVAVVNDLIIAGTSDKKILCFENNGNILWENATGGSVSAVVALEDLIIAGSENKIYCYNPKGNLLWGYSTEGNVSAVAALEDSIIAGSGKKIYCLSNKGNLLWKKNDIEASVSSVCSSGNLIFVGYGKDIYLLTIPIFSLLISTKMVVESGAHNGAETTEAEKLYEMAKHALEALEKEKAQRLLRQAIDLVSEQIKRIKIIEKPLDDTKTFPSELNRMLEAEYREIVKEGIIGALHTIADIEKTLKRLIGKKANIEMILSKERKENEIQVKINDYKEKIRNAKQRGRASIATSYAVMVVNLKRRMKMKKRMEVSLKGVNESISELSDFSRDLFESVKEFSNDVDLLTAFSILNNGAKTALSDADKVIDELTQMEKEMDETASKTEQLGGEGAVNAKGLSAGVRAEIERELDDSK